MLSAGRDLPIGDAFRLTVFENGIGILRVPHRMKEDGISLIRSVESVRGVPCVLSSLKTSGTIRKLKNLYLVDEKTFRDDED